MEILPSEYQNVELSRYEKMFVRHAISYNGYGFLLLKVNPTMIENESMNVVITSRGVVFLKFFEDFTDASLFGMTMQPYAQFVYPTAQKIISEKLLGNKSLSENRTKLKFPINIVYVFPSLKRADVEKTNISSLKDFVEKQCLFFEEFSELRQGFGVVMDRLLDNTIITVSADAMQISDLNVNSIMQRIAPEYVTVRVACVDSKEATPGVDSELLVIDEKDVVVKAFRLDIYDKAVKGIRLRKGNILVGDHQTLNIVFKDARFNGWSIGEIFAIDKLLIPNARRDNFEKNPAYFALFEQLMTIAAGITKDIRAASLKRNAALSNAIEQLSATAQQATIAIDEGVSSVQKGLITKKLKEAQIAVSNSATNEDSERYYQDIAFAELDMLIGKLKGTTKYKALNTIDKLTTTEKKILERVIQIIDSLELNCSDQIIEAILNDFST